MYKKIIIGLGNSGPMYSQTRHNAGQICLNRLAQQHGLSWQKKFDGQLADFMLEGIGKVALFKPGGYMNESGRPVRAVAGFYKVKSQDVLVWHDDIDLQLGRIKVKLGGGHGGHNGLRSVDANVGTEYWRIRIGVGRPQEQGDVATYVLSNFSKGELEEIGSVAEKLAAGLEAICSGRIDVFMASISQ